MVKKLDSKAISITPKRSGTATISYKQKGMTKHFTIKVLAYKSPAKTLKVGKHNYAKLFKSTSFANSWGVYGVPGKIKIKPASGWHVSSWRGTRHLGVADPAWGSACVNPPARADRLGRGAGRRLAFVGWGWYCQRIEIVYRAM